MSIKRKGVQVDFKNMSLSDQISWLKFAIGNVVCCDTWNKRYTDYRVIEHYLDILEKSYFESLPSDLTDSASEPAKLAGEVEIH